MIIGTAGHIDHGKTSLVKALTGVDADRLKEEKERGITLDLGYAYVPLANGEVLGFVDVPGHERLVHNMLAGATGIDFVLLVIAADDGPMPQTREHLQILDLLGLARGAIVLTKTDAADSARCAQVETEIRALLATTALREAPLFRVSNLTGEGVAALRAHLEEEAAVTAARTARGHFRLAVDRCFTLTGTGTVVTGTVYSGVVRTGDRLLVSPGGREVRVRSLHAQNRAAEVACAGQRCALNLAGVEKQDVRRGHWIVAAPAHAPTTRLDVRLRWVAPAYRVRDEMPVHVHIGACDVMGRLAALRHPSASDPGLWAQLVLDEPIGTLHGDRVVLRDQSAQYTLAGGVVIDAFAPARKRRAPARLAILAVLENADPQHALRELVALSPNGVDLALFARSRNLDGDAADLWRQTGLVRIPVTAQQLIGFTPARWQELGDIAVTALADSHAQHPELLGLNAPQLRRASAPTLAWGVFNRLIEELVGDGRLVRRGPWLHLPGHKITLNAHEQKLWALALPLLAAHSYQPPRVRDIARALNVGEAQMRTLLQRQTLLGETYLVAHDHYFLRDAFAELVSLAATLAAADPLGQVRAAEFRNHIGTGRKLAIQILECFDRMALSRRVGDAHQVYPHAPALVEQATAGMRASEHGRDSHPGGAAGLQIR